MNKNYTILAVVAISLLFIIFLFMSNNNQPSLVSIDVTEFKSQIQDSPNAQIIDFRTPEEVSMGKLKSAQNIDFYSSDLIAKLEQLDKNQTYFIYCNSGNRSKSAMGIMKEMGFTNVRELSGGIQSWMSSGNEVCTSC
jgi:rhodanese-related sulfurtransferase